MALSEETKKKIIQLIIDDRPRRQEIAIARQYYYIDNPILRKGVLMDATDLRRKADNRIAHNFHQLITDEEVDYLLSYMPIINIGSAESNKAIVEALGDKFLKKSRALDVEACNSGCAWLHYWINDKKELAYAPVPSDQIIAVMKDSLEEEIDYLIRYYPITRTEGLKTKRYTKVEVWSATTCEFFLLPGDVDNVMGFNNTDDGTLLHKLGAIPFIPFPNNNRKQGNIKKYKGLIDAYDIVVSGYVNDVMDVQEVIYILENYGGTDLNDFIKDLKRFKTVAVGDEGIEGTRGDLRTLTIEIPVEARNSLLDFLKKQIYTAGQALSRDVTSVGNASGQTLKFFYRDIDLKVGDKEVEFKAGFSELVRILSEHKGIKIDGSINIAFTRNRISNDQETAQICRDSVGIIPTELIWTNHPFVDDIEKCRELWEKEKAEEEENEPYDNSFTNRTKKNTENDPEEKE
jgi:Phage portal protein, SPP1 Gp6-like.